MNPFRPQQLEGLPDEILLMIFKWLSTKDHCQLLSVSHRLASIARDPSFWPEENKSFNESQVLSIGVAQFKQLFSSNLVKTLNLRSAKRINTDEIIQLLELSTLSSSVDHINLALVDLSQVPGSVLALAVAKLKRVNLEFTELGPEQTTPLFLEVKMSTSLKYLNISYVNLSDMDVPCEDLSRAVGLLQEVVLESTWLKENQVNAVISAIMTSQTLESVNLDYVNLSRVEEELFASAVHRLKNAGLCWTKLTKSQKEWLHALSKTSDTFIRTSSFSFKI